jgi:uncharacterized protein YndB with AHSA1/START domain
MRTVTVSIEVPRPIAEVWSEVARLERHAEWMVDVEHMAFIGERRTGVGTVMRVRTRVGPFVTTDDITVDEWAPPRLIAVTHGGRISGTGSFVLEEIEGGTRFTRREELHFRWYLGGALAALAARPVLRHVWKRNLEHFADSLA